MISSHHSGCFNPVLGFLSVSTVLSLRFEEATTTFQSRAGFSECLDSMTVLTVDKQVVFQSRAGFSECLDAT